jgi:hypothetical protein
VLAITLWAVREAQRAIAPATRLFLCICGGEHFHITGGVLHYLTMLLLPLGSILLPDQEGYFMVHIRDKATYVGMALVGVGALLVAYETSGCLY